MATSKKLSELSRSDMLSHMSGFGYIPRWGVLLLDLFLCLIAFWTSVLVGSGIFQYEELGQNMELWLQCLCILGVQCISFWVFHTYSGILRYSTFVDTLKSLFAVLLTGATIITFNLVYHYWNLSLLFSATYIAANSY